MKWSFPIARIRGIEVKIHVTFFLLLAWIGWQYYVQDGWGAAIQGILFILALFFCVLLHEFGHAFMAMAFGIRTPDITLLPIGGVARLERIPENPLQELAIAVAGPAVNIAIAAMLFFGTASFHSLQSVDFENAGGSFAMKLLAVNLYLVAFNMIPAFPMDGGRILRALLAIPFAYAKATQIAARIGQGIAVVFAMVGIFGIPGIWPSSPMLLFIAFFVFMAAQQENAFLQMRETVKSLCIRDIMLERFRCLPAESEIKDCTPVLSEDTQLVYPVVGNGLEVRGIVDRGALMEAVRTLPGETPLSRITLADIPKLTPEMPIGQAIKAMQTGYSALPVANPLGQVVGLILFAQLVNLTQIVKNKPLA